MAPTPEPERKPAKSRDTSPERKRKRPSVYSPERKNKKVDKSKRSSCAQPAEPEKKAPTWTPGDEVRILKALAAHRQEQGKVPSSHVLFALLDGVLDRKGFGRRKLRRKVSSLRRRYDHDAMKGTPPTQEHECRLYHLSKNVWGDIPNPVETSDAPKTFDEMSQSYPYLAQEVMHMVDEPVFLERVLPGIDDSKALALDSKIKELRQELSNAINESARMQNIEVHKVSQHLSTKLQPAKSRAKNDTAFLQGQLDKIDGASAGAQEQLARLEHQIVELKKIVLASQSSPKAIRSESAESAPQSVVAENQISCNILQKKITTRQKFPHGKNKEVTSKYRGPPNVEPMKVASRVQQDFSHDRNEEGGKEVILLSYARPYHPVAKGTLQASSPSTIVGSMALGPGCCQVFVNEVLEGEAQLIRPFGNMNKMADALGCSIAWPREKIRHGAISGTVAPDQPSRPGQWRPAFCA